MKMNFALTLPTMALSVGAVAAAVAAEVVTASPGMRGAGSRARGFYANTGSSSGTMKMRCGSVHGGGGS
jgi:hypothetical protein